MGNCTSKKSRKSLKLSVAKKPIYHNKMDKEHDLHTKGLSKKIAPFTKGEITSFGFKKKQSSQLPVPVTLTSNGHSYTLPDEKNTLNGVVFPKNLIDGYQSGSSIESLCHAPFRSTPKMIRKKDLVLQQFGSETEFSSLSANNAKNSKTSSDADTGKRGGNIGKLNSEYTVNRFGFRHTTPPKTAGDLSKNLNNGITSQLTRTRFLNNQGLYDVNFYPVDKRLENSTRSRSEGPREVFFKQTLQSTNSVQSGLNQSKTSLASNPQPGKFTLQTSHLPRPQFPVRMSDTKTAKTATNYYRRGGIRCDSNSSKEGSPNEDSGFESHTSGNSTLEKDLEILDSSPGAKIRRRLPAYRGKKLEMKIVGNKFELLKKDEEEENSSGDVVTKVSLIKLPTSNVRTSTAVINTGLVEQRTNQYLKKISQLNEKKVSDQESNNLDGSKQRLQVSESSDGYLKDEGLGGESEEEKLFKDSKKSEKICEKYLMSNDCGYGDDDMLPGEAMADDISLNLSFEDESCSRYLGRLPQSSLAKTDTTPNSIRLDALKLSKELKYKNCGSFNNSADIVRNGGDSSFELLTAGKKDEEEEDLPGDSFLEQLSSDSDSLGDKGENKNNDKEKNLKMSVLKVVVREDLDIDSDEEENNSSKTDISLEENDLESNADEREAKEGCCSSNNNNNSDNKNCLGNTSPDLPGTPTPVSNSLSLSEGRDFLIDDEIADQPQLCFPESYVDCSCQEDVKTCKEKSLTSVNNEFVIHSEMKNNSGGEVQQCKARGKAELEINGNRERCQRLNSEGTLSPCESIASDDLMLDFESNSFEETAGRFGIVNENSFVEKLSVSTNCEELVGELSSQAHNEGTGVGKSLKTREGSSGCSTPASTRSSDVVSHVVSSSLRSSRSLAGDEEPIKLDNDSYRTVFQDIASIKAMLLKLKRMLTESEGEVEEKNKLCLESKSLDGFVEDEITDLRRQVLFLQQQLEEREKTVQVLKLEINKASDYGAEASDTSRKQCNAATQTGSDQFQQDFPHFRIFQTTPVV